MAGRSAERLDRRCGRAGRPAATWPRLIVDLLDASSVRELAVRTRVVVTTAGPYSTYGRALVEACAAAGTSYADLTGETLFVRDTVASCHALAERTGARIVPSCGFDSIPSDLGVGLRAAGGGGRATSWFEAVLHVRSARGGISGGTIDSLRQQILAAQADTAEVAVLDRSRPR